MASTPAVPVNIESSPVIPDASKSWRFYLILVSLSFTCFVCSLDGSILGVALPKITTELSAAGDYVWIANSFFIAQTVVQPFYAQICNVFGRRIPMLTSLSLFMLGSGIAGGARNSGMLIAGRTIQGCGSGGLMMLIELIICDLVPLRERGKYLGMVLSGSAVAAILGPVVGGALAIANWRWIFYLNVPIAGVTLVIMTVCLRLHHEKESLWMRALLRIDWIGNFIFIASQCSLLIGLIFGGTVFPWSSFRVILPIVLGVLGWTAFHFYEWKPPSFCKEVSVPPRIFGNRTSAAGFYIDFISSLLLEWSTFFWPFYFQALKGTSPLEAGVDFIPYEAFLIVTAGVAGGILSQFGHYRPLHLVGFGLSILGPGLNIMLSKDTPKVAWVFFQLIDAVGRALLLPTVLPAIMASLPESDVAATTGMFSFLRSLGFLWGITIPSIIFNTQFDRYSTIISDPIVRQELADGRAYQFISSTFIHSLEPGVQQEVLSVYRKALRAVWIGAVAFGFTGLAAVFLEKHIPLRTELSTNYGMEHERVPMDEEKEVTLPEVREGTIETE